LVFSVQIWTEIKKQTQKQNNKKNKGSLSWGDGHEKGSSQAPGARAALVMPIAP
jgi:hypothetical protein